MNIRWFGGVRRFFDNISELRGLLVDVRRASKRLESQQRQNRELLTLPTHIQGLTEGVQAVLARCEMRDKESDRRLSLLLREVSVKLDLLLAQKGNGRGSDEPLSIDTMLDARIVNALKAGGISSVDQLTDSTFIDLLRLPGLGKYSVNRVVYRLGEFGLSLKP